MDDVCTGIAILQYLPGTQVGIEILQLLQYGHIDDATSLTSLTSPDILTTTTTSNKQLGDVETVFPCPMASPSLVMVNPPRSTGKHVMCTYQGSMLPRCTRVRTRVHTSMDVDSSYPMEWVTMRVYTCIEYVHSVHVYTCLPTRVACYVHA